MKTIYCRHGRHRVHRALIHDMAVQHPMCLDCRARMQAEIRTPAPLPLARRAHRALPSAIFRMIPR